MKKLEKYLPFIIGLTAFFLLCCQLYASLRYSFYYREQQQLLVYSLTFFQERFLVFGGLSLLVSQFLIQFFTTPQVGVITTAMIDIATAGLLWLSFKKISDAAWLFPICMIPVLLQTDALADCYYDYQGLVAFFLMAGCLYLYTIFADKTEWKARIAVSTIMGLIVYFILGAIGVLFSFVVLMYDVCAKRKKAGLQLISIAVILITGLYLIYGGHIQSWRFTFLNDAYYEPVLAPPAYFMASWIAMIILPAIFYIVGFIKKTTPLVSMLLALTLSVMIGWNFSSSTIRKDKQSFLDMVELLYDVGTERWDELLQSEINVNHNFIFQNLFNLALSHKGALVTNLFDITQYSPASLIIQDERGEKVPYMTNILSHIYYQMGNIAAAQDMAFDSYVGCRYGCPNMLKMLVKTNLIYGSYHVAEKYIALLEKTWAYREWAKEQRRFLNNDPAIEADAELGMKRKDLTGNDRFAFIDGPLPDLLHILETGTTDIAARDYAIAYVLLARDNENINRIANDYYGTEVMKEMPVLLQQALIAVNEDNLDYCKAHGVTEQTIAYYETFKKAFIEARNTGRNPAEVLNSQFGSSYWYYYLFVGIQG